MDALIDPKTHFLYPRVYLILWLMVYAIVVTVAHRRRKTTGTSDEQIFLTAGFSLGGAFALFKVLVKVITDDKLQQALDWDGAIAIIISSGLGIFLALKEVKKLL
jgi:hypothetical protein